MSVLWSVDAEKLTHEGLPEPITSFMCEPYPPFWWYVENGRLTHVNLPPPIFDEGVAMLIVNNKALQTPKSVTYSQNKLWSQNTGRLDNGYFVGELIAVKKKYEITFPPLTPAQLEDIRTEINANFATVRITNAEGGIDEVTAYFGDLTVESYSWRNGINYAINATVSIIER